MKKDIGIICMLLGVMLTIMVNDHNKDFIDTIKSLLISYWPLVISFIGIYMISDHKKRR